MRRTIIAGNWKMNLTRSGAVELAKRLRGGIAEISSQAEIAVCPPSPYLDAVGGVLEGSPIALGAQNVYHEENGAFTGEVSAAMLVDLHCRYVILGHSERRHILGETNSQVNRKLHAALRAGLTPIVCVGETLEEREADKTLDIIQEQFSGSLAGISESLMRKIVIAYEPVWAIGTGKVATPEQAQSVHASLRKIIENRYNSATACTIPIQYGGSVKPDNAAELLAQPDIDGALVGGASLKVESFLGIISGAVS